MKLEERIKSYSNQIHFTNRRLALLLISDSKEGEKVVLKKCLTELKFIKNSIRKLEEFIKRRLLELERKKVK